MVFNYDYSREAKKLENTIRNEINMSAVHIDLIERMLKDVLGDIRHQIDMECARVEAERRQKALEAEKKAEEEKAEAEKETEAAEPEVHADKTHETKKKGEKSVNGKDT